MREADRPDGETSGIPDSDASFEALLDEKVCRCADVHAVDLRPERSVEIGAVESEQDAGAGCESGDDDRSVLGLGENERLI